MPALLNKVIIPEFLKPVFPWYVLKAWQKVQLVGNTTENGKFQFSYIHDILF